MPPTLKNTPEEAMRLARVIVSDMAAYHGAKIDAGVRDDNLFDVLSEEIEEGRATYNSRVDPSILRSTNFFDRAIVDVLILPRAKIKSRMW